jgi:hypothetical protein
LELDRLLRNTTFGPDETRNLRAAYEEIARALMHPRRPKIPVALAELIAGKIIAFAQSGERDRGAIVEGVLAELGIRKPFGNGHQAG